MLLALSIFIVGLAIAGTLIYMLLRNMFRSETMPSPQWLESFSVDRYRPMQRLLAGADFDFLARECGYKPSALRKVRAERRRIFRMYLRNLTRDFNRIHLAARLLLLDSPVDRPDLAEKLVKSRLQFMWALSVVQLRLALSTLGLAEVDVRNLIGSLEGLQAECNTLMPARVASF